MTCIVGLVDKGNVYIGGDSAAVEGLSVSVRADEKVFVNGPFLMGFTTSFRMGQLLRYKFIPPNQIVGVEDMKYMVNDFIPAVHGCFQYNGFGTTGSGTNAIGGTFLVGFNGKLYRIDSDFQVGIPADPYSAVGCGADLALGSMFSTVKKKPEDRIRIALEAASHFSGGVTPPFVILKQDKVGK